MITNNIEDSFISLVTQFYKINPFYYDSHKTWWLWDQKIKKWNMSDETDIINVIYNIPEFKNRLLFVTKSKIKSQLINALKMVGRQNKPEDFSKEWVQFKDLVYNIKTGISCEAIPQYFNCNVIPWDVGISEDTPILDKLFEDWVGKDNVPLLYEIIAYCCLQDYPLARLFCLIGSGRNGKSCFLKIVEKFVGSDNTSSTELDGLMQRFGTNNLYKKLVCVMGETNFNKMTCTSIIKKLTGNDTIDYEFKGKDRFVGLNYAKLLIATNTLPTTSDRTDGFYRRWVLIYFDNNFEDSIDILATIPDIEYQNLGKKCISIISNLIKTRKFTNEGDISYKKSRFEEKSNPLGRFVKEYCVKDLNEFIPSWEFTERINVFLLHNGYRQMTKSEIKSCMLEEGFDCVRKIVNGKDWYCFVGVSWRHGSNGANGTTFYSTPLIESLSENKPHMTHMPHVKVPSEIKNPKNTPPSFRMELLEYCKKERHQEELTQKYGADLISDCLLNGDLFVIRPGILKTL